MTTIVLDTGPLGLASNPKASPRNTACQRWVEGLVSQGVRVLIPEIADYEVRRELLRANKAAGIARLDQLKVALEYLPISTEAMLLAAQLWAQVRQEGQATAADKALDGDVILAAQTLLLGLPEEEMVIASDNVGHLSRFAPARHWEDIA